VENYPENMPNQQPQMPSAPIEQTHMDASANTNAGRPLTAPPNSNIVNTSTALSKFALLKNEIAKAIVGQDHVVTGLLCAILAGGHVLLEGVPGVAKTLMVKSLAAGLDLETKRVQFTPDLMPSDVTGQMIYNKGEFKYRRGPVFTNLLLADEINRTPPKTQASLLQAMEEGAVSIDGTTKDLPNPFMVIATENPIEYEGTYPLPEAQRDRFLLKIDVGYPTQEQEVEVVKRHHNGMNPHKTESLGIQPVTSAQDVIQAKSEVEQITVDDVVIQYIVSLIRATRESPSISLGASPRAAAALMKTSKAWAYLSGKSFVTPDEVKSMTKATLRHRVLVRPELEIEGITSDQVLDGIMSQVPVP